MCNPKKSCICIGDIIIPSTFFLLAICPFSEHVGITAHSFATTLATSSYFLTLASLSVSFEPSSINLSISSLLKQEAFAPPVPIVALP